MQIKVSNMLLCGNTPEVKAVTSIIIDDGFAVHGIKVILSGSRLFVAMPDTRAQNGNYYDVAHPINMQARQLIVSAVLKAYHDKKHQEE